MPRELMLYGAPVVGLVALAAYGVRRLSAPTIGGGSSSSGSSSSTGWELPEAAAPYADTIRAAETHWQLPRGLLGRLLYQESRFRPDIINGDLVSSAGAVGIAQIVPRWHPNVNPVDANASIWYAAKYLSQNYSRFGSWQLALAAYNWGPGNLGTALELYGDGWLSHAPRETRNYVAEISADVGGLPA